MTIRAACADDLTSLVEIEQAAGETFRSLGVDLVADDDPGSPEELTAYAEGGRAFVALDADDRPLGYLLLDIVDDAAHIAPNRQRKMPVRSTFGVWLAAWRLPWLGTLGRRPLARLPRCPLYESRKRSRRVRLTTRADTSEGT